MLPQEARPEADRRPLAECPAAAPVDPAPVAEPDARCRAQANLAATPGCSCWSAAAHPRQAILTAAGLTASRGARRPRPPRAGPGLRHRAGGAGHRSAGTTTSWTASVTPPTRPAASRSPRGCWSRAPSGSRSPAPRCSSYPSPIANGVTAGSAYLVVARGRPDGQRRRSARSWLSWLPWAVSYGLYPAFLSYGGWGGAAMGDPPEISITVLAGALGRLRPLPAGAAGAGRRQPGRLPPPAAAGRPARSAPRGCCGSRSWLTVAGRRRAPGHRKPGRAGQ